MAVTFEGYHGTSFEAAAQIAKGKYTPSIGDLEWLGDGVYFFLDGLSKQPDDQAEKWAVAQAWDNGAKKHKYLSYCVLKSVLEVDEERLIDLTASDGVEVFNYIIDKHIAKMASINKRMTYIDGFVINFARGEGLLNVDIAKGNFYIKFTNERINNINRRIANCTICAVHNLDTIKSTTLISTKEIII